MRSHVGVDDGLAEGPRDFDWTVDSSVSVLTLLLPSNTTREIWLLALMVTTRLLPWRVTVDPGKKPALSSSALAAAGSSRLPSRVT